MYFQIMIFFILISFLLKIIILKNLFIHRSKSDESCHLYRINRIKWHNHRFIKDSKVALYNEKEQHPLLYHWILSFFPIDFIKKNGAMISICFDIIFHLLIISFGYIIIYLNDIQFDLYQLLFLSIFLIFSPYIFDHQNARNFGLSVRTFANILGLMSIFFLYLYLVQENFIYLILSAFMLALAILTSQFAMQAIIFSIPIVSISLFRFELLLILPLGFLFPLIISYDYSIQLYKLIFGYYGWYFKIGSKIKLLKSRPSIWLDIFYIRKKFKEKGKIKALKYYWNSPILRLLFNFPLNLLLIIFIIMNFNDLKIETLFIFSIICIILFIFTSFNLTRFLGQPERYSEYFQVFIFVFLLPITLNYMLLILVLAITLINIAVNVSIQYLSFKREVKAREPINLEKKIYDNYVKENDRVLFKTTEMSRKILRYIEPKKSFKLFWGGLYSKNIGKYKFEQVFNDYSEIKSEKIPIIVEEFKINLCIIDEHDKDLISNLETLDFEIISKINGKVILRKTNTSN